MTHSQEFQMAPHQIKGLLQELCGTSEFSKCLPFPLFPRGTPNFPIFFYLLCLFILSHHHKHFYFVVLHWVFFFSLIQTTSSIWDFLSPPPQKRFHCSGVKMCTQLRCSTKQCFTFNYKFGLHSNSAFLLMKETKSCQFSVFQLKSHYFRGI